MIRVPSRLAGLRLPALVLLVMVMILAGCGDEPQPARVTIPAPPSPVAPGESRALPADSLSNGAVPAEEGAVEAQPPAAAPWAVEVAVYHVAVHAEDTAQKLTAHGYAPLLSSASRPTAMTRLLMSVCPANGWQAQLAAARRLEATAFPLKAGRQVKIYAGTYRLRSTAAAAEARLAGQGIVVKREAVTVELPVTVVRVGGFVDQGAAAAAALRLRELGYGGAAPVAEVP